MGKVETTKEKQKRTWVEDELSTVPGATVTVSPYGTVRIKRKAGDENRLFLVPPPFFFR